MATRFGIERETDDGWERLALFVSEDAAIKRLQRERELECDAAGVGWIIKPGKIRLVAVKHTDEFDLVSPDEACPCGERRIDWLVWDDDGINVTCATCGATFTPGGAR